MKKWLCIICGWIYDEAKGWPSDGIAPGTRWQDIPDDWLCPECGVGKADFEMIEVSHTQAESSIPMNLPLETPPIVIIGTGYAGYNLAQAIRERSPDANIVLFTTDDGSHYSKPGLSNAFARGLDAKGLVTETLLQVEARLNVRIYGHCQITHIDTQKKLVTSSYGEQTYSKLVLAQGAQPIQLSFQGDASGDVMSVNNLLDYHHFREAIADKKHITVIGNGLIGCEFANDLCANGYKVSVVGLSDWPMDRLIPKDIGEQLQANLSEIGTDWYLNTSVERIERKGQGYLLTLTNGETLTTDFVMSAVGLKARTQLAQSAGIDCNLGIIVNGGLRTSVPDVYAIGDCAEIQGQVLPYIAPINYGIRALANCLLAKPTMAQYPLMPVMVKTPVLPLTLLTPPIHTQGHWQVTKEGNGIRALYLVDDKVMGFALAGNVTSERQQWLDRVAENRSSSVS